MRCWRRCNANSLFIVLHRLVRFYQIKEFWYLTGRKFSCVVFVKTARKKFKEYLSFGNYEVIVIMYVTAAFEVFHCAHLCACAATGVLACWVTLGLKQRCAGRGLERECSFPDKFCALSLSPLNYALCCQNAHKPATSRPLCTEHSLCTEGWKVFSTAQRPCI